MSNKLVDNKRRSHAEKVLKSVSKKASHQTTGAAKVMKEQMKKATDPSLKEQYEIIRKDILKLRDDLAKGYDLAKNMFEKKSLRQILNVK